ncbi:hypothetical protein SAY87_019836 [Trapa incisa]|uniref:Uncharacterized protein n=1 Tax=Trapa incisa TaxID=236973 RepID=A0AAN7K0H2_9MYRT|nr:hypothetical protein SAY87_019836 [Trapa incisa]
MTRWGVAPPQSCASELPETENDLRKKSRKEEQARKSSSRRLGKRARVDTILLVEQYDSARTALPENEIRTVESDEAVTTVTFRPADHMVDGRPMTPISFRFPFRHGRPCHHCGHHPFNLSDLPAIGREIPYGNDKLETTGS